MKVLSLFDGISCGMVALERVGIKPDTYYASEIDKNAIEISSYNYPEIIRLGDVREVNSKDLPPIDLFIGGSPCTNLSFAGKGEGLLSNSLEEYLKLKQKHHEFKGQSFLFWEYIRLLREIKPTYYLLENVRMSSKNREVIDKELGSPIFVESANFSGAMRKRFYWTNIPVPTIQEEKKDYQTLVNNKGIRGNEVLKDVWNGGVDITERYEAKREITKGQTLGEKCPVGEENEIALTWIKAKGNTRTLEDKAKCLTATGQGISNSGGTNVEIGNKYYTLDPITAERLMTLPDDYTKYGSEGQEIGYAARHKAIGNGWTVDVICEIFKGLNSPV